MLDVKVSYLELYQMSLFLELAKFLLEFFLRLFFLFDLNFNTEVASLLSFLILIERLLDKKQLLLVLL